MLREKRADQLLPKSTSLESLDATRSISDQDLSLREDSGRRLAANIGDTTVDIDIEERTIVHRCPTLSRLISEKRFCPHVVKLFLNINAERARNILSSIHSALDSWKFES